MARLCSDQSFLALFHRRHVAALYMLYEVNSNSNHCLFSELPSASVRVRHSRDAAAAHPLEFEVSMCRTSKFARCFLPSQTRVWNDLPYSVFHTRMLDGLREQSIVGCFPELCFFQFFVLQVLVGLRKQFMNNFVFPTWACAAGFNNYYNNNNCMFLY